MVKRAGPDSKNEYMAMYPLKCTKRHGLCSVNIVYYCFTFLSCLMTFLVVLKLGSEHNGG